MEMCFSRYIIEEPRVIEFRRIEMRKTYFLINKHKKKAC